MHKVTHDAVDNEDAGDDPVRAQNKQYKTEIASHQAQLEALREQDPEFYEYLQQTDQELLKFGQDDDADEEEAVEDASDIEEVTCPYVIIISKIHDAGQSFAGLSSQKLTCPRTPFCSVRLRC